MASRHVGNQGAKGDEEVCMAEGAELPFDVFSVVLLVGLSEAFRKPPGAVVEGADDGVVHDMGEFAGHDMVNHL